MILAIGATGNEDRNGFRMLYPDKLILPDI